MGVYEDLLSVIVRDDTGEGVISRCNEYPPATEALTQFELDLRDWGCVYGIAFALTQMSRPFASVEECAEAALDPARSVYARWGGAWGERYTNDSRLARRVIDAYNDACFADLGEPKLMTQALRKGLRDLAGVVPG